jgi:hypothetical protein
MLLGYRELVFLEKVKQQVAHGGVPAPISVTYIKWGQALHLPAIGLARSILNLQWTPPRFRRLSVDVVKSLNPKPAQKLHDRVMLRRSVPGQTKGIVHLCLFGMAGKGICHALATGSCCAISSGAEGAESFGQLVSPRQIVEPTSASPTSPDRSPGDETEESTGELILR